MLIFLPLVSFVFTILLIKSRFPFWQWRVVYILTATILTSLAVIFIEIASLSSSLTKDSVFIFWLVIALAVFVLFLRSDSKKLVNLVQFPKFENFDVISILGIVFILIVTAKVAFYFPSNNWDSMTYHLPRVMHWAADAKIAFFPTQIDRQLFFLPGAEFILLHIFLLTGNDQWFNLLQWGSYLGCIFAGTLITSILGASLRSQVLTAVFITTIPMAILQSTSTQNDLFVSFWILTFVAFFLLLRKQFSKIILSVASMALGLGVLAKGTSIVVLPFFLFLIFFLHKKGTKYIALSLGIVLILVVGHFLRSWNFQDGRLISSKQYEAILSKHDPSTVLVNALSQGASEFMLPWGPANRLLEKLIHKTTQFLNVDISSLNMFGRPFKGFHHLDLYFDEDFVPNSLQVILIMFALIYLWRLSPSLDISVYCINVVLAFFMFVFFIKWQLWINRLHLPLFMLSAPIVGIALGRARGKLVALICFLLFFVGILMIIHNFSRPIKELFNPHSLPREAYYFMKKSGSYNSYKYVSSEILSSGCRDVDLIQQEDSWEYPLWALTGFSKVHFRALKLENFEKVQPCMIVTVDGGFNQDIELKGKLYKLVFKGPSLQMLKPVAI